MFVLKWADTTHYVYTRLDSSGFSSGFDIESLNGATLFGNSQAALLAVALRTKHYPQYANEPFSLVEVHVPPSKREIVREL